MKYTREWAQEKFNTGEHLKFVFFWGHGKTGDNSVTKNCLSQWWDCRFTVDGVEYHTAEQFMMAQKAVLFGDEKTREQIMAAGHPKQYKELGRRIFGFNQTIWNRYCCDIVIKGNTAKFSQNEDLKSFLLNTNTRILVEASPYDKIWGIGMAKDDPHAENPILWNGTNFLGFCLMEVRDILRDNGGSNDQ